MQEIRELVEEQRKFYNFGGTKSLDFRLKALTCLQKAIKRNERLIQEALRKDLKKSNCESYMAEIGMVYSELSYVRKHLPFWDRDKTVLSSPAQFPARSFVRTEPYGLVLILSPWNYPFMLSMEPLIGAIAAGNCCIVKPSAYASHTSSVICRLISEIFPQKYAAVVEGGRDENTELLNQRFDYIFFTGSVAVGKIVMEKASEHLTPVSLELGGKSPCIIEESADLNLAAKRVVFGKFLNSGQTCVAPDYCLVQESVIDKFLEHLIHWTKKMYGNIFENSDYPRIINEKHFERLLGLLNHGEVFFGGNYSRDTLKIEPTILYPVNESEPVMQEEIFGPLIPVLTYKTISDADAFISKREKPLALYLFTKNPKVEQEIMNLSFGGGCINDTIIHLATSRMGFGGVGSSGMGSYHGKKSYETFTHSKSIVKSSSRIDIPLRYPPYGKRKEKLIRMMLR
ncbi:aldehyde dehydrogenase [Blautia liquoris]|uniref:Aldehyde dehydrogenase n=1 Tax=Blautia liquoris TaxID=2779518 RepID=A0A7M2RDL2_9FIRM|nr:aldehyde dehydrogenase [Blautia liquoris]QOV18054.1 aldehyde dehydrogenase [Blautia liquoris]